MKIQTMQNNVAHFYDFFTLNRCDHEYIMEPNWHEDIEILFGVEGENTFLIDGQEVTLKKGEAYVINPNFSHSQIGKPNGYSILLKINNQFLISNGFSELTGTFIGKIVDKKLWEKFINTLDTYFSRNDLREVNMRISLLDLIAYVYKNYYTPNRIYGRNRKINSILKYLNDNYTDDISLTQLAQSFNCNKCYLAASFKKETGFTIMHYIDVLRCNYADSLLKNSTLKIKEIAQMCGFGSISSFNKTYKAVRRQTPRETRLNYKRYVETGGGIGERPNTN